ncbi:MAG: TrpB-like pyridoxal phosphate-dependent enzyme [Chloroflexi bacterium]|nr:TrpB-like pyridoxal phosphate-dependent enzyme [Chloroflexota bacterium]
MIEQSRYHLSENDIPRQWYNIQADLPVPLPPVFSPVTLKPVTLDDLSPIFPKSLIGQEISLERYIDIPPEVLEILGMWRPTPLVRAHRLERALGTPAKIFFKNESVSPVGSHKPNTAVAQAFYNKIEGTQRLATETGAGQWGAALAMACKAFEMACKIYMVRVSYDSKPYRRSLMRMFGADVVASPSMDTASGRAILAENPNYPGALGIAISEAVDDVLTTGNSKYSLGSVLNHVLLHQTVIGQEAIKQLDMAGEEADVVIGCVGGGSNFGGIALPFMRMNLKEGGKIRCIGVEPSACPTMTKGSYAFDYGDTAKMAPVLKMKTLGHDFMPPSIHAGGLRYHGMSPILSALYEQNLIEACAYGQKQVFEAATLFAQTEGIVPAPESAHAIRAAIDEANDATAKGDHRVIVFCLSGHGFLDLGAYDKYMDGELEDYDYPEELITEALERLPQVAE